MDNTQIKQELRDNAKKYYEDMREHVLKCRKFRNHEILVNEEIMSKPVVDAVKAKRKELADAQKKAEAELKKIK